MAGAVTIGKSIIAIMGNTVRIKRGIKSKVFKIENTWDPQNLKITELDPCVHEGLGMGFSLCAVRDRYVLVTGGYDGSDYATGDAQLLDVEKATNCGSEEGSAD